MCLRTIKTALPDQFSMTAFGSTKASESGFSIENFNEVLSFQKNNNNSDNFRRKKLPHMPPRNEKKRGEGWEGRGVGWKEDENTVQISFPTYFLTKTSLDLPAVLKVERIFQSRNNRY